ncbi:hypothetical protein JYB64_05495 [Algoriphagus aestuarii]|nr:hypothetical protein [Algoriphagus aestuarii]
MKLFKYRKSSLTICLFFSYMVLLVFVSCIDQGDANPFGSCPPPRIANAKDLMVTYAPYENSRYSTEKDTVSFKDFAFNLEIVPEVESETWLRDFPGRTYALSCAMSYNFKNISNIAVTLLAPYQNLPVGTDISYLLKVNEELTLNKLRDFGGLFPNIAMKITLPPSDYEQLKTRTFLFLKDGSKITVDSNSPYLLVN